MLLAIRAHLTVSFGPSVSLLAKKSKLSQCGASKPVAAIKKDVIINKPSDLTEIKRLAFSLYKPIDTLILLFPEGVPDEFYKDISPTLLAKGKEDREHTLAMARRKRFLFEQETLKIIVQKELEIEQLYDKIQESV